MGSRRCALEFMKPFGSPLATWIGVYVLRECFATFLRIPKTSLALAVSVLGLFGGLQVLPSLRRLGQGARLLMLWRQNASRVTSSHEIRIMSNQALREAGMVPNLRIAKSLDGPMSQLEMAT